MSPARDQLALYTLPVYITRARCGHRIPKVLEPCKAWLLSKAIPALSARFSLNFHVFRINEINRASVFQHPTANFSFAIGDQIPGHE